MSGVVVEVRVKEGQEIKKGDPVCGEMILFSVMVTSLMLSHTLSAERHEGNIIYISTKATEIHLSYRWNLRSPHRYLATSNVSQYKKVGESYTKTNYCCPHVLIHRGLYQSRRFDSGDCTLT
jgi:hypothetical protein